MDPEDATNQRSRRDKLALWQRIRIPGLTRRGTSNPRLNLLALPPEIRTAIYEYALIEPDKIKIRTSLRQPALLSTNRQTRQEAGLIWFERNKFLISIWDCNASLFAAFANLHRTHQRRYETSQQQHLVYHIVVEGVKDWNNLVLWCYAVWANMIPAYKMLEPSDEFEAFVSVATNVAKWHRDKPWEECYMTLNALRYAVAKYDRAWWQPVDQMLGASR